MPVTIEQSMYHGRFTAKPILAALRESSVVQQNNIACVCLFFEVLGFLRQVVNGCAAYEND